MPRQGVWRAAVAGLGGAIVGCATAKPTPAALSPEGNASVSNSVPLEPVPPVPWWAKALCVAGLIGLQVGNGIATGSFASGPGTSLSSGNWCE